MFGTPKSFAFPQIVQEDISSLLLLLQCNMGWKKAWIFTAFPMVVIHHQPQRDYIIKLLTIITMQFLSVQLEMKVYLIYHSQQDTRSFLR